MKTFTTISIFKLIVCSMILINISQANKVEDEANKYFNLALKYEKGEGVKKDKKKAYELYKKAADKGLTNAMYKEALMYYNGEGVAQNKDKAIMIFKILADKYNFKKGIDILKQLEIDVVVDKKIKYIWQDDILVCDEGFTHEEAESYCSSLVLNGLRNWRLPSYSEWQTIDTNRFKNCKDDTFWTSTEATDNYDDYYLRNKSKLGFPGDDLFKVRCITDDE